MRILRWLFVRILAAILGLSLSMLSLFAILYATVLSPSFAKSTIAKSGLYDNFVNSSLDLAAATDLEGEASNINQVITDIRPTISQILTPSFLRTNTETVIDAIGNWLNGKTALPEFAIDTGTVRTDLNNALVDYINQRLSGLPICSSTVSTITYDALTAQCQLPVAPSQTYLTDTANDFSSEIPILGQNEFNTSNLVADASNSAWQDIPNAYRWGKLAPFVWGGLVLVIIALILSMSTNRPRSVRKIGHLLVGNGIFLVIIGTILVVYFGHGDINFITSGSNVEQVAFIKSIVVPLVNTLSAALGFWLIYFGAGYAVIGGSCYFIAHWLKKRQTKKDGPQKSEAPKIAEPPAESKAKTATPASDNSKEKDDKSASGESTPPGPPELKPPLVQ
jgi:hypothetical protein